MISDQKKIIFIGNTTATGGDTIAEPGQEFDMAAYQFKEMDVVFKVNSIGGSTPTLTLSVQEKVNNGAGADVWIETANSGAKGAAGVVLISNSSSSRSGDVGGNPLLGGLGSKRFVVTAGGTVTACNADIYVVLHN